MNANEAKIKADSVNASIDAMRIMAMALIDDAASKGLYSCSLELRKSPFHHIDKETANALSVELTAMGYKTESCVNLKISWE